MVTNVRWQQIEVLPKKRYFCPLYPIRIAEDVFCVLCFLRDLLNPGDVFYVYKAVKTEKESCQLENFRGYGSFSSVKSAK